MTVKELLSKIDSREIAEWEAYENATGPLGFGYIHETLAALMDEMKVSNVLASAKFEDNPYPTPDRAHVRPSEMHQYLSGLQKQKESIEESGGSVDPDIVSEEEFARQLEQRNS